MQVDARALITREPPAFANVADERRHRLTVDEAAWWFICMERAAQSQLLAEAAGTPEVWSAESARGVAGALGSPGFGWLSFQTLWDEVVDSDPDLFE